MKEVCSWNRLAAPRHALTSKSECAGSQCLAPCANIVGTKIAPALNVCCSPALRLCGSPASILCCFPARMHRAGQARCILLECKELDWAWHLAPSRDAVSPSRLYDTITARHTCAGRAVDAGTRRRAAQQHARHAPCNVVVTRFHACHAGGHCVAAAGRAGGYRVAHAATGAARAEEAAAGCRAAPRRAGFRVTQR